MFFVQFIDVVVKLFWRVGEVDVEKHLGNVLGGVGGALQLALFFQGRVYLCGLVLVINVVLVYMYTYNLDPHIGRTSKLFLAA